METGNLTVTGKNSTRILLSGYPHRVSVYFVDVDPVPCNTHHHHHDHLHHEIEKVDEDPRKHRKLVHHHHDRQFYLFISWDVSSVREIHWSVHY